MSDTPGLLDSIYRVQINRTGVVVMDLGNMGTLKATFLDKPELLKSRCAKNKMDRHTAGHG